MCASIIIDCPRKSLLASQKVLVVPVSVTVCEMLRFMGYFDVNFSINDPVKYNYYYYQKQLFLKKLLYVATRKALIGQYCYKHSGKASSSGGLIGAFAELQKLCVSFVMSDE